MAKKKSQPKPANKAGLAARTAQLVKDKGTNEESSSSDSSSSTPSESDAQNQTARKKTSGIRETPKAIIHKSKKRPTRALIEIKRLQKSTELLIPKAPFIRVIKEIIAARTGNQGFRVTETAVEALREASEAMLTTLFEDSNLLALHAKRVTLMPRDMSLLLRLRNDSNLFSN